MRKIGFTGTQVGMSLEQKLRLMELLKQFLFESPDHRVEFHHGDCVGADEEAHGIALSFGCDIVIHPPLDETKRAFCDRPPKTPRDQRTQVLVLPPDDFLVRNAAIVVCTAFLIGAPKTNSEVLRSGTWSTIRAARRQERPHEVMRR